MVIHTAFAPEQNAQLATALDQARRQVLPVGQAQRAMLAQARGEGLTGISALHVIQVLALRQGMQLWEVAAGDAAQEPFLLQQRRAGLLLTGAAGRQGLEQPGLVVRVAHPVDQRLARFAEQPLDLPALEFLAVAQPRRQWPVVELVVGWPRSAADRRAGPRRVCR